MAKRPIEAKVAGRNNDPLAGLAGGAGAATLEQPDQPAGPPQQPPAFSGPTPFSQPQAATKPKRRSPGRLIGARMDASYSASFDQLHLELKNRLSNPSLSVDTVVAVILERALADAEAAIEPLELAVRQHQAAKIQGQLR